MSRNQRNSGATTKGWILATLMAELGKSHPRLSAVQIGNILNIPADTIRWHLKELRDEGLVLRENSPVNSTSFVYWAPSNPGALGAQPAVDVASPPKATVEPWPYPEKDKAIKGAGANFPPPARPAPPMPAVKPSKIRTPNSTTVDALKEADRLVAAKKAADESAADESSDEATIKFSISGTSIEVTLSEAASIFNKLKPIFAR